MDQPDPASIIITVVNDTDVLLGRGNGVSRHAGNVRFREYAETRHEEFDRGPYRVRASIATDLFHYVQNAGGRFLQAVTYKKDGEYATGWEEVQPNVALDKAKQALRDRVNNSRKKKRNETSSASRDHTKKPKVPSQVTETEKTPSLDEPVVQGQPSVSSVATTPSSEAASQLNRVLPLQNSSSPFPSPHALSANPAVQLQTNDFLQLQALVLLRQRRLEEQQRLDALLAALSKQR